MEVTSVQQIVRHDTYSGIVDVEQHNSRQSKEIEDNSEEQQSCINDNDINDNIFKQLKIIS